LNDKKKNFRQLFNIVKNTFYFSRKNILSGLIINIQKKRWDADDDAGKEA